MSDSWPMLERCRRGQACAPADGHQVQRHVQRGDDNPIFEGSVGVWDGVIIHVHENIATAAIQRPLMSFVESLNRVAVQDGRDGPELEREAAQATNLLVQVEQHTPTAGR